MQIEWPARPYNTRRNLSDRRGQIGPFKCLSTYDLIRALSSATLHGVHEWTSVFLLAVSNTSTFGNRCAAPLAPISANPT